MDINEHFVGSPGSAACLFSKFAVRSEGNLAIPHHPTDPHYHTDEARRMVVYERRSQPVRL